MRRRYGTMLLVLALLLAATSGAMAAGSSMNFKDADIRDVLQTLGDLAGVNIAAEPQVQGNVTMFLQGMDALDALDLVIRTHGYHSLRMGNTLVIGSSATLSERFESNRAVFFPLKYAEPERLARSLQLVLRSATVQADEAYRGVLVLGTEEQLREARS